jgi:arylsulfatase A-like enzyme
MKRRTFMQVTGAALAWAGPHALAAADTEKPNLLFVFSDQQSWDFCGCYGNKEVKTPVLDKMAEQGVRFEHCVSQNPVCTPYRAMLMSGQHPLRNGCLVNDIRMLPGKGTSFAEVLNQAGYYTGYVGKWHLLGGMRQRGVPKGPLRYGFDNEFFTNNCTVEFGAKDAFYWNDKGRRVKFGKFESDGQTDQAVEFLDKHAGEKPFALFVSWHPPHNWRSRSGYDAPKKYMDMYDANTITLRPTNKDTKKTRQQYHGYMALCSNVDDNLGRLIDKLEAKGVADNTLVVFTSDHGDVFGAHGWRRHKNRPHQISSRVPLVMKMPKAIKPHVSNTLVGTLDLMPTVLGLMGITPPDVCEGRNYAQSIRESKSAATEYVPMFFWGMGDWRGVYTHRYTYSFQPEPGGLNMNVLFDREKDPYEMKNLFNSDEHKGIKAKLHAMTLASMKEFGDKHVPWSEIKHKIYVRKADARAKWEPYGRGYKGVLKGRPIDLI